MHNYVQLVLQHKHSSDKSRQKMKASYEELHISWVLEHRVCHLPPPNMLASNCQREEVLALLPLVADLDPRPLSNHEKLVASCNLLGMGMVVITAEIPCQDDLWRTDSNTKKCIEPNVDAKYGIILSGVLHLQIFYEFDVIQDFPLRLQLWNCYQLVKLIWNPVLLSVRED